MGNMIEGARHSDGNFITEFLTAPRFRKSRYALLILAIAAVALNQNEYIFIRYRPLLGNGFYLIVLFTSLVFIGGGIVHATVLVPRYMLRKKYGKYFLISFLTVTAAIVLLWGQNYAVSRWWNIPNVSGEGISFTLLVVSLMDFVMYFICFTGIAVSILLKNWVTEDREIARLQNRKLATELSVLKDQLNPGLLFNTLRSASAVCQNKPRLAEDMIMNLSGMLRYQLYEGENSGVAVNKEIKFLDEYLNLSILTGKRFTYDIRYTGEKYQMLIPPLILYPLISAAADKINEDSELEIMFTYKPDGLVFDCKFHEDNPNVFTDFSSLRSRLGLIYGELYGLEQFHSNGKCRYVLTLPQKYVNHERE
ncbi:MAG: histidine kinase [Rikenellaceae bacterium]|nr:histidine kinase [Rikenellaceae bacterium]